MLHSATLSHPFLFLLAPFHFTVLSQDEIAHFLSFTGPWGNWVRKGPQKVSSPTFCSRQGHLRSDQIAQGFMQLGLETLQGWRLHNFPGHIPLPGCAQGEKVFLHTLCNLSFHLLSLMLPILLWEHFLVTASEKSSLLQAIHYFLPLSFWFFSLSCPQNLLSWQGSRILLLK